MRRAAAIAAVVMGVALIVMPFAASLFSRSKSAERLADGVRPAMTKQALVADRAGLEVLRGAMAEFNGPARASMARAAGETPQQFASYLDTRFPAVASGARDLPTAYIPHSDSILTTLERNRTRFETADDFPIAGVSARVAAWLFVALGAALAIVGVAVLRTRGAAVVALLLVLGLVPLVAAAVTSLPHKASETDRLVDKLSPAFAEGSTKRVPGEIATAESFDRQLEGGLLPALGRKLSTPPRTADQFLQQSSPTLARDVPKLKPILTSFNGLGTALMNDRPLYAETAKIPTRTLVWLMIGASFVVALAAALALFDERRSRGPVDRAVPAG